MAKSSSTLSNLVDIIPRKRQFDLQAELSQAWHGNNVFRTAFFNALSMQFPKGEHAFIESLRAYRDQIDGDQLKAQVRAFIGQEGFHSREHQRYNDALVQRYGEEAIADIEARFSHHMDFVANLPRSRKLAGTCAAEHFTAAMAQILLSNPAALDGVSDEMKALWHWHAVEEIEHKAVAYDVFQQQIGSERMRLIVYGFVTYNFSKHTLLNMLDMLKAEGKLWSPGTWIGGANFLWGRPGVLRRALPHFLAYLRPGFHPWDIDDRPLIAEWKARYEPELAAESAAAGAKLAQA
ncbi:MAG: metal-dependent hydrolase [Halomonadaceae bacterium]|nr:MAG: metal-dependent hydrolase [Halomonadaceae bacterium]